MTYAQNFNTSEPTGLEPANTLDEIIRNVKIALNERFIDILGVDLSAATDPQRVTKIIIPAAGMNIRNSSDSANLIALANSGATLTSPTLNNPTLTSPTLNNPTLTGTMTATGATISGGTVTPTTLTVPSGTAITNASLTTPALVDAVLAGTTVNGGTFSGGTVAPTTLTVPSATSLTSPSITGGSLSGTITNSGTISGGTLSPSAISGTITNSGTINGGTVAPTTLTIPSGTAVNLTYSNSVNSGQVTITSTSSSSPTTIQSFSLAKGTWIVTISGYVMFLGTTGFGYLFLDSNPVETQILISSSVATTSAVPFSITKLVTFGVGGGTTTFYGYISSGTSFQVYWKNFFALRVTA